MSLSPKQARFVQEYLIDLNATQAAIRAGYSKKSAQRQGSELLAKVNVSEAISEAQAQREKRTNITQDWALARLKKEAEREEKGSSHSARVAALGLVMKHLGMLKEDAPHPDRLPYDLSKLTDDALQQLVVILTPIFTPTIIPVALDSSPTGTGTPDAPAGVE